MKRILIPATVLLIILLALTACGGKKAEPTTAPAASQPTATVEKAAATQPAAAPEPTKAQEQAPTEAPEPTAAPQPTEQPEPTAAAEELPIGKGIPKSYVMHMESKEEVVKPKASVNEWTTMEMKFQLKPEPVKFAMTMTDKTGEHPDQEMKIISVEDATYILTPEESMWMKMPRGQDGTPGLDLASSIDFAGKLAAESPDKVDQIFVKQHVVSRHEKVDGVDTTHYRLTNKQLDILGKDWLPDTKEKVLSGQEDFWIANKGNYLKQYTQDLTVKDAKGRQIHRTSTMLITDENKPVHIEVPPEDQVRDMTAAMGVPTAEPAEESTTNAGTEGSESAEVSPEAAAFLNELPTPPKTQEVAEEDMPADMKFYVQMMGQQGPYRAYLSDTPVDEVRAFYNDALKERGFISPMGDESLDMGQNVYMSQNLGVQLVTQADENTGKTMIVVQVMGE